VDEAVAQALQRLGLTRAQVDVEVLHAGSPGRLLGFGAEPARVRVSPKAGAAGTAEDEEEDEEDQARALLSTAEADDTGAGVDAGVDAAAEVLEADENTEDTEEDEAVPENLEGEAELARLMLVEMLNRMDMEDTSVQVASLDPVTLNIQGDDVADLIGRRGETLRAIQFILNLMLNKQLRRRLRVTVDVDGYRARREELLRNMAMRFASRVRATREPMQLETMPPNERRIIHLVLSEDPDVMTESVGEGDARRVVIRPRR
jgi:spoIIIJ-associated protein